jgi:hypothetical protein
VPDHFLVRLQTNGEYGRPLGKPGAKRVLIFLSAMRQLPNSKGRKARANPVASVKTRS